ncbi:LacI family DNA-binding transcriptional regulator [Arthrobacter sp. B3I4]|uniref:LacI family DNA-binding transcriptional regulator n=1 Tax=Arthrobacter sp. B3I4 TaxID=3042267 RepID=UPI002787F3EE|nr:LacI family DNA-binding transcriptional regulator [Arthrobacter sp. B3I4]MDQ0755306.1 DNA-binding LacI/PurR family transcriptional regulator [Arthrobacter sp. B3I4]
MSEQNLRTLRAGPAGHSPTLEDLATAAGVSRSTASRAINGGSRVSPEALAAVNAAVIELGYTPNRAARSLVTRRTSSIALVINEPDARVMMDPFFAAVITGVTEALRETEMQLVLLMSRAGGDPSRTLRYLRGGHVDGAIIVSHHKADGWTEELAASGLPTVFIGRPWDTRLGIHYVDVDSFDGARQAALHLAAAGRTRLGTITGPLDMTAAADRLRGWQAGLSEAGLPAGPVAHGDFTPAGGTEAAERLLSQDSRLDGIFAASDLMARGAITALLASGRAVPGDVAVVGFDDHLTAPGELPLTTVNQPTVEMAAQAGRLLLDDIENPGTSREPVIFPARLVVRASSLP